MKLLIITQKMDKNDPILGFFQSWIREFAKHYESVLVICLEKGEYDQPDNVRVFSLGKEERQSRLQYLIHFYWCIIHERKKYDEVFVHMNQIYVGLGGIFWKLWHKKIMLWYTHRAVSSSLRIAALFSDSIFTATKESFNIPSKKVHIVGHGIETSLFKKMQDFPHTGLTLLSVGRITRIKNLETLIEAVALLKKKSMEVSCKIIGPKVTPDDHAYFAELQKLITEKELTGVVEFMDAIPNHHMPEYYWKSDIHINLAPTGGIDKAVLESIVAGSTPLVANEAFAPLFGEYKDLLVFKFQDAADLADKIVRSQIGDKKKMLSILAKNVEENYQTQVLIGKIVHEK